MSELHCESGVSEFFVSLARMMLANPVRVCLIKCGIVHFGLDTLGSRMYCEAGRGFGFMLLSGIMSAVKKKQDKQKKVFWMNLSIFKMLL